MNYKNSTLFNILLGLLASILLFFALGFKTLAGIAVVFFLIFVAFYVVKSTKPASTPGGFKVPGKVPEEPPSQSVEDSNTLKQVLWLKDLNFNLRTDPYRDDELVELTEDIVDSLLEILGKLTGDFNQIELKEKVRGIIDNFLPGIFGTFFDLSVEDRLQKKPDMKNSLQIVSETLHKVQNKLDSGAEMQFNVESKTLEDLLTN